MSLKSLMISEIEGTFPTYSEKELEILNGARLKYGRKEGFSLYMGSKELAKIIWFLPKAKSKLDIASMSFFQRPSLEENKKCPVRLLERAQIFLPYKKEEEKVLKPWPVIVHRKVRPRAPVARLPAPSGVRRPLPWPVTSEELRRRVREHWGPEIASLLERVIVRL